MAQASTETVKIRQRVTGLLNALENVDAIANLYSDLGGEAFFDAYLETNDVPNTDITTAEFVAAMTMMATMQTFLNANRSVLTKLLI